MKKIVLTGGGTAGHVTPNLALIPHLAQAGWEISYIGSAGGMERGLVEPTGVPFYEVATGKLRRYLDLKNLSDPFRVLKGAAQAYCLLGKLRPDLVFSKGGFVSVPVVYGAALRGIPVVLHESDLTPGLANKLCMPFAKAVCTTFPETAKSVRHGVYTGTPLRDELFAGQRSRGLAAFGFSGQKPVLMVTGGSSGAQAINAAVRAALPKLLADMDVLHLCGRGNLDPAMDKYSGYRQVEYLTDKMCDAFACADILVSRAGSNTLCEILALKKPSLLIPYPKGASRGDQVENAASFAARGLARVLDQDSLTPESLVAAVRELYASKDALRARMDEEPAANGTKKVLEILERSAKRT
ncbi:MAG: undecaprenyldiphospho-muramoylpentapeptide beta-N-acetylglucosaminyltransferase [Candidatus Spyradocola sp.]